MIKPRGFAKFAKPRGFSLIVFDEDFADCFRLLFGDSFGDEPGFGFVGFSVAVERVEFCPPFFEFRLIVRSPRAVRGEVREKIISRDVFIVRAAKGEKHERADSRSVRARGAVEIYGRFIGLGDQSENNFIFVGETFESRSFRTRRNGNGCVIYSAYVRSAALIGVS